MFFFFFFLHNLDFIKFGFGQCKKSLKTKIKADDGLKAILLNYTGMGFV